METQGSLTLTRRLTTTDYNPMLVKTGFDILTSWPGISRCRLACEAMLRPAEAVQEAAKQWAVKYLPHHPLVQAVAIYVAGRTTEDRIRMLHLFDEANWNVPSWGQPLWKEAKMRRVSWQEIVAVCPNLGPVSWMPQERDTLVHQAIRWTMAEPDDDELPELVEETAAYNLAGQTRLQKVICRILAQKAVVAGWSSLVGRLWDGICELFEPETHQRDKQRVDFIQVQIEENIAQVTDQQLAQFAAKATIQSWPIASAALERLGKQRAERLVFQALDHWNPKLFQALSTEILCYFLDLSYRRKSGQIPAQALTKVFADSELALKYIGPYVRAGRMDDIHNLLNYLRAVGQVGIPDLAGWLKNVDHISKSGREHGKTLRELLDNYIRPAGLPITKLINTFTRVMVEIGYKPTDQDLADPELCLRRKVNDQIFWGSVCWKDPDWTRALLVCYPDAEKVAEQYLGRLLSTHSDKLSHDQAVAAAIPLLQSAIALRPNLPHTLFKLVLAVGSSEEKEGNIEWSLRIAALVLTLVQRVPEWLTADQAAAIGAKFRKPLADNGQAVEYLLKHHPGILDMFISPDEQFSLMQKWFLYHTTHHGDKTTRKRIWQLLMNLERHWNVKQLVELLARASQNLTTDEWLDYVLQIGEYNNPRIRNLAAQELNDGYHGDVKAATLERLLHLAYPQLEATSLT